MAETLQLEKPPMRRRLDVDGYYRMAEAGILASDERVELIDGEIIEMSPIGSAHAAVTDLLNELFAPAALAGTVQVGVQRPVRLGAFDEPQPDLVLLRPRPDRYRSAHPGAGDVLLAVEVAASSLNFDRTTKLPLYARHGIPELWIVDLAGAAVEVCRAPRGEVYGARERLLAGLLAPVLVPSVAIDVEALFQA